MSPIEFEVNCRNRFAHRLKKLKFVVHDLNRRVDARKIAQAEKIEIRRAT